MVSKVTYNLRIPTKVLKKGTRQSVIDEIASYIEEQTLQDVGGTRSPVTGRIFRGLSKGRKGKPGYKQFKAKQANPIANLELTGDMLDSFTTEKKVSSVEIGIFDEDEAQKADNHNKFSAKSKRTAVPDRKFIPNKKAGEFYRPEIKREIIDIIKENAKEGVSKSLINGMLKELNGG